MLFQTRTTFSNCAFHKLAIVSDYLLVCLNWDHGETFFCTLLSLEVYLYSFPKKLSIKSIALKIILAFVKLFICISLIQRCHLTPPSRKSEQCMRNMGRPCGTSARVRLENWMDPWVLNGACQMEEFVPSFRAISLSPDLWETKKECSEQLQQVPPENSILVFVGSHPTKYFFEILHHNLSKINAIIFPF